MTAYRAVEEEEHSTHAEVQRKRRQACGQAITITITITSIAIAIAIAISGGAPPSERVGTVRDQGVRQHRRKGQDL